MIVGVVEIGGMLFAIPISSVREVIPAPATFQRLPSQHPDLLGGVILRGKVIPVQSLHRRLGADVSDLQAGPAEEDGAGGVIVVVRDGGRVAGLLVDSVRCLLQLGDMWRQNIAEDQDGLICGGYICDTNGHFSMLSVAELLRVPLAPSDEISETARRRAKIRRDPYIRFRVGELNFLVAMKDISSTVPTCVLEPWPVAGGSCLGLIERHGMEMPMLDTLANLGFPSPGLRPQHSAGIILEYPDDHALAFNVDHVSSVMNIEADAIHDFPPSVTYCRHLFSGVHIDEHGEQCFVIDVAACCADPDLRMMAEASHRKGTSPHGKMDPKTQRQLRRDLSSEQMHAGTVSRSNRYLTISAGGEFAVPIEAVSEIMRLPAAVQDADFDGHLVNLSHRDRLMPVYDCAQRRGYGVGQFGADAGILVLQKDGHHFGLAVEAMKSIDTGRVKGFETSDGRASDDPAEQLVELGYGATKRLLPIADPTTLLP
nr:chemotaxis protein CheW [Phaeobacter sp. HF9A]